MGDAFLPDIKLTDLQAMLKKEPAGKPRDMLLAAIKRKEGCSEEHIGECLGRAQSTISGWLHRLQSRGLEGRYDCKSPGRPCRLSEEQQKEIHRDLSKEPHECGFERGTWTSPLLALHMENKFGIKYASGGSPQAVTQAGVLSQKAQARPPQDGRTRGSQRIRQEHV